MSRSPTPIFFWKGPAAILVAGALLLGSSQSGAAPHLKRAVTVGRTSPTAALTPLAAAATPFRDIASAGPLTHIYVGNDLSCQVAHAGDAALELFPNAIPGDCGTFVAVSGTLYAPDFGNHTETASADLGSYVPFSPVSQSNVTGSGTSADPYAVLTTVNVGATGLRVEERDTYDVGDEAYRTQVKVTNTTNAAVNLILYRAGDCYLSGSDIGFGFSETFGALKAVGCAVNQNNSPPGRIEEWVPITGGNSFFESAYGDVWSKIGSKVSFPNTCACATSEDDGAGISWTGTISPASSQIFVHETVFSPTGRKPLVMTKTADSATSVSGEQNGYTITISNPNATSVPLSSITDQLPVGFAYSAGSSTGLTTANPAISQQTLTWSGSFSIAPNAVVTLRFKVKTRLLAGTYLNNASAEAQGGYTALPTGPTAQITITRPPSNPKKPPNPKKPGTDSFPSKATLSYTISLPGRPLIFETVKLTSPGKAFVSRGALDKDSSDKDSSGFFIPTEINDLTLVGKSPRLGRLALVVGRNNGMPRSTGRIEHVHLDRKGDFLYGDSYFNVFFRITADALGTNAITNPTPIRVAARIWSLPPNDPKAVQPGPTDGVDHFKCYKLASSSSPSRSVKLSDRFVNQTATMHRPERLCVPVSKTLGQKTEPITQPKLHLLCYRIKTGDAGTYKRDLGAKDQFGTQRVTLNQPEQLCVPSLKRVLPAGVFPSGDPKSLLDHFKCYGALSRGPRVKVKLVDQFEKHLNALVGGALFYCPPAEVNGMPIFRSQIRLTCYKIELGNRTLTGGRNVEVKNQFGTKTYKVLNPESLCVPSTADPECSKYAEQTLTRLSLNGTDIGQATKAIHTPYLDVQGGPCS